MTDNESASLVGMECFRDHRRGGSPRCVEIRQNRDGSIAWRLLEGRLHRQVRLGLRRAQQPNVVNQGAFSAILMSRFGISAVSLTERRRTTDNRARQRNEVG